jgi:hypothetical protein
MGAASIAVPLQARRNPGAPLVAAAPLAVTVKTDKGTYAPGAAVEIVVRAANRSAKTVKLRFATAQQFEVEIRRGTDGKGPVVWRWSSGMGFAEMISTQQLAPGKSIEMRTTCPDLARGTGRNHDAQPAARRLPPGKYTVVGILTLMDPAPKPTGSAVITVKPAG